MLVNFDTFITELWPSIHVRILFLLIIARMNGWNLTKSVINMCILMCYNTSLGSNGCWWGNCVKLTHF